MLLDKLISRNIGTYLVTYGYSGVGKSYTLFGAKGKDGLLQSTVKNISTNNYKELKSVELRVYELYGLGLGYSECYENYDQIDQSIYHYNIVVDDYKTEIANGSAKKISSNDASEISRDEIYSYVYFIS